MRFPLRILHLEDNPRDAELIREALDAEGIESTVKVISTREDFLAALEREEFDLILSDHHLSGFDGFTALEMAVTKRPYTPLIFVTGSMGEEQAIETLRLGATDYVLKHRLSRLGAAVRRSVMAAKEKAGRRRAEEALRESEERFRAFMDHSQIVAFIKDNEGRYVYVNQRFENLYGTRLSDSLGKTDFDLLPAPAARHVREHDAEVWASGKPIEVTEIVPTPDGVRRHWLVSKFIMEVAPERRLLGGIAIEITERKKAEEQIRDQAALLDKAQDAIFVCDLEDRILYWNKSSERIFDWTSHEILGRKCTELFKIDSPLKLTEPIGALGKRDEWSGELTLSGKGSQRITVESRWTLVRHDNGAPKAKLVINTDITERLKLEAQLLRSQRMESIGALAGGIAHDLNNVLAPIILGVEVLKMKFSGLDDLGLLETLETSAQRGSGMVKQILTFARGAQSEKAVLQLRHVVSDLVKVIKETFPKSIQIQLKSRNDLWTVKGDPTQLAQVLMNLCVNARDAMPKGGQLEVTLANVELDQHFCASNPNARPGSHIAISVSDTGAGISPDIIGKIFDPFFTTKDVGKGSGLGLSSVIGIVKSHGGFLTVHSEVNKGTLFNVYLPAIKSVPYQATDQRRVHLPLGNGERVLVVDDELTIREMTKETLQTYGYRVTTANDGTEALAIFAQRAKNFAAVITDMSMPFMDGFATVHALLRIDPHVKIILISGLSENSRIAEVCKSNCVVFLPKPFTTEQLLTTLHPLILRSTEPRTPVNMRAANQKS